MTYDKIALTDQEKFWPKERLKILTLVMYQVKPLVGIREALAFRASGCA